MPFKCFIAFQTVLPQTNKDKQRSAKCLHFCFSFDTNNYCPTCRESGKGDDPCIMFESPCGICAAFSEEQLIKITHRKHYVKKQKIMNSTSKGMRTLSPSLDLRQNLRVLQTICYLSTTSSAPTLHQQNQILLTTKDRVQARKVPG